MPAIHIQQHEFHSPTLNNTRPVWTQAPASDPVGVIIFLDAEYYLTYLQAATTVESLIADGTLPPLLTAYVAASETPIRWKESFCNDDFATMLVDEMLPWLRSEFALPGDGETILAGLSLTGLSAVHAALKSGDVFTRVLSQSGSFWWNDEWLSQNIDTFPASNTAFRIVVGDEESDENVDHGDGLIQVVSQRDGCLRMRDALLAKGHPVSYAEYHGGHQLAPWREELAGSLTALMQLPRGESR